ncbi:MAG TPA: hypothetical protein VN908_10250 [Gemmatimonadales bacterium]|nr:hypothetical protein [Gemmatimonadales bacterium]
MSGSARLRAIMEQRCPGHRFEREPGFFQGAMYVSWVIGVFYLGVLAVLANIFLAPRIGIAGAAACVIAIHLACVPSVFRYSRVIWAHLNVRTAP